MTVKAPGAVQFSALVVSSDLLGKVEEKEEEEGHEGVILQYMLELRLFARLISVLIKTVNM